MIRFTLIVILSRFVAFMQVAGRSQRYKIYGRFLDGEQLKSQSLTTLRTFLVIIDLALPVPASERSGLVDPRQLAMLFDVSQRKQ